jgi:catechol 2,3-dioxygenase-like lactoylglutathione lyase family enzyme
MVVVGLTPILNVSDVPASLAWFEALGWSRTFTYGPCGPIEGARDSDEHGRAGFAGICSNKESGAATIFLCHDAQGSRDATPARFPGDELVGGVWMSWWVDSLTAFAALHATCVAAGFVITKPPEDEAWGVREFHLRHPDGHVFRVSASLECAG